VRQQTRRSDGLTNMYITRRCNTSKDEPATTLNESAKAKSWETPLSGISVTKHRNGLGEGELVWIKTRYRYFSLSATSGEKCEHLADQLVTTEGVQLTVVASTLSQNY